MPDIVVNSFGGGVGHVNISFGEVTYGRNSVDGSGTYDGVQVEEIDPDNPPVQTTHVSVTQEQYDAMLAQAKADVAGSPGYDLFGNNCVTEADRILQAGGFYPGSIAKYANPGVLAHIYAEAYGQSAAESASWDGHSGSLDPSNPAGAFGAGPFAPAAGWMFLPMGGDGSSPPMWAMGDPLHPPPRDPLVIDLNNNGLELSAARTSSVHFDLDQNGYAEQVSWVGANDAILINDANHNGAVDGAAEFFGDTTEDGFDALRALDANNDGALDAADPGFAQLLLWRDLNQDGVSEANELQSAGVAGIQSISLATTVSGDVIAGTRLGFTSTVTTVDAQTHTIASAYLDREALLSVWQAPTGFTISTQAQSLPDLHGYGDVKDLRAAMTLDGSLAQKVQNLVDGAGAMSSSELKTAFEHVLQDWMGVAEIDPASRGVFIDARHLSSLEHLYGSTFEQFNRGTGSITNNPDFGGSINLEETYSKFFETSFATFMAQLPISHANLHGEVFTSAPFFSAFLFEDGQAPADSVATQLNYVAAEAQVAGDDAIALIDRELSPLRGAVVQEFGGDPAVVTAAAQTASMALSGEARSYFSDDARVQAGGGISLLAGSGAATLTGLDSDDLLHGGSGNDWLEGGKGDDTYYFGRGGGQDTISEGDGGGYGDHLVLATADPHDVILTVSGEDVTIHVSATSPGADDESEVTLLSTLYQFRDQGVEDVTFADGTTWDQTDIRSRLIAQECTSGNDQVQGFNSDDTIAGGAGNDTIDGGNGSDVYIWARGDGADVVNEGWLNAYADTLRLQGVSPEDVSLVRSGSDLIVRIAPSTSGAGDGGSVTLTASLDDYYSQGVEFVKFDDGTTWSRTDLRSILLSQSSTSGNDLINGFNSSDTITGGGGDDTIDGGAGADRYVYSRGDGADVINEGWLGGKGDTLYLKGIAPSAVTLVRNGGDVTLQIAPSVPGGADGGSVKLVASLDDYYDQGVEQVVFEDGTVWTRADMRTQLISVASTSGDDSVVGTSADDILSGGLGNDTLDGGGGADRYLYTRGDGKDVINETWLNGSPDKLVLHEIAPSDVTLVRSGNDVTLMIAPSAPGGADGGSVKLLASLEDYYTQGVEQITFDDGTTWSRDDIRQMLLTQASTFGNDSIAGFGGDDTITGGAGDDTMDGGAGADTYIYNRGDGADVISEGWQGGSPDRLVFHGITSSDVTLMRNGGDVTLQIAGGGSVKLLASLDDYYTQGDEQVLFDDGTVWLRNDLRLMLSAQATTPGDDNILGFGGDDSLAGGAGNDTLNGGAGNDVYVWSRGDGADLINEGAYAGTVDKLVVHGVALTDITFLRSGSDVTLQIAPSALGGDGGSVKLLYSLEDYLNQGVEQVAFDDGTVWSRDDLRIQYLASASTPGNDSIVGFAGADTLTGGAGADTLAGSGGNDVFRYVATSDSPSGSLDVITDFVQGTDRIDLTAIDANPGLAGDQAFVWIGSGPFSNEAAQLRYAQSGTQTTVYGDVDGDGVADFAIQLTKLVNFQASDFVL